MSTSNQKKYSSMPKLGYSEAFKRQVVTEFEQGLISKAQLRRKYGISGHVTLDDWLRKYGKLQYQTYYKKISIAKECIAYQKVKSLVLDIRASLPRIGCRKIYHLINQQLRDQSIKMGRDKLFSFLRAECLLVPKRKRSYITTNSKHWMRKYPNSIKDVYLTRPEQVWVADITYLQAQNRHYYLHLITEAYSKKIVGYQLADNLLATTSLKALKMAIKSRVYQNTLIHHSDRGLQYCSRIYTKLLIDNNIQISMTENADPYENAIAERVNGILKDEFLLDANFESIKVLKKHVQQSISNYNQIRPHLSLLMETPCEAHLKDKIKLKKWKKQNPNRINEMGYVYLQ